MHSADSQAGEPGLEGGGAESRTLFPLWAPALVSLALLALIALVLTPDLSGRTASAPSGGVPRAALQPTDHPQTTPPKLPGRIKIVSDPWGAAVRLNGEYAGSAPLEVALPPRQHRLEVSLSGYHSHAADFSLAPGQRVVEDVRLQPKPASLGVKAQADDVQVFLNNTARGPVPLTIGGLAPGPHRLRLETARGRTWEQDLHLLPGEHRSLEIALADFSETFPQLQLPAPDSPLAVIIENYPDARPQSGLDAAEVVYEALAEGGITRFLALYLTSEAPVIGPVRSARHYFVHWAAEYGAPLVHIGSSPQGFSALSQLRLPRVEAIGPPEAGPIWRSSARLAPHNAYTFAASTSLDGRVQKDGSWAGLRFKASDRRFRGAEVTEVTIHFNRAYGVRYVYQPEDNLYLREMAGQPHRDAETAEQLAASTVAVLRVPTRVADGAGRLEMNLFGQGPAVYFLDGTVIEGSWRKPGPTQPTDLVDSHGVPVLFNPGRIWIQIVPPQATVLY